MFELHQPICTDSESCNDYRPTVVCFVSVRWQKASSILLVYPKKAKNRAWILPQGGINPYETPLQAGLRELNEECGFDAEQFALEQTRPLVRHYYRTRHQQTKDYYVVGFVMTRWSAPVLNEENKRFELVSGPHGLWSYTVECSDGKKQLLRLSVLAALEMPALLHGPRWRPDRIASFLEAY
jgi:8-oxo-dGTP pyrophosphatase MutT (NUDIX family)